MWPEVDIIHDLGGQRLPAVTTGYQNFGLSVVTGKHCLNEFQSQVGYRLPVGNRNCRPLNVTTFVLDAVKNELVP